MGLLLGSLAQHKLLRSKGMDVLYKFRYFLLRHRNYGCAFKVNEVETSISEVAKTHPKTNPFGPGCCYGRCFWYYGDSWDPWSC